MSAEHPSANPMLTNLRERATGMCRPEEFMRRPGVFEIEDKPTGEIRPHTLSQNEEYELTLTVGVRYWANNAQRASARKNAESILTHTLYENVLSELVGIRHAVYDGDQLVALRRIATLEERLRK